MKTELLSRLAEQAAARTRDALTRRRRVIEARAEGQRLRVDGRQCIDFASNDYLGLATDSEVCAAFSRDASRFGVGSGASPLVSGHTLVHHELEQALAGWTGFESVLLLPSGYQANLAVGLALVPRGATVLADRLNHASLNDSLRLAGARIARYRHADLTEATRRCNDRTKVLVTDGVFSMDGDLAPLAGLAELTECHGMTLWVDDAHGLGVLGEMGRGCLEHLGVARHRVDVLVGTFGKAFGTAGAFIAGTRAVIEHIENTARPLIYSTALSPALCSATRVALDKMLAEPDRRQRLWTNIHHFRDRCDQLGLALLPSHTPIQILPLNDNRRALDVGANLLDHGLLVGVIRPPTVPAGSARLRITLSASHAPQDIDHLAHILAHQAAPATRY